VITVHALSGWTRAKAGRGGARRSAAERDRERERERERESGGKILCEICSESLL
jgi:hypothetical protein